MDLLAIWRRTNLPAGRSICRKVARRPAPA